MTNNLSKDDLGFSWFRPKYHGQKDTHIYVSQAGWQWLLSVTAAAKPESPNIVAHIGGIRVVISKYVPDDKVIVMERDEYGDMVPLQIVQLGELTKPMEAT